MTRKDLMETLKKNVCPTFPLSKKSGTIPRWLVVASKSQIPSVSTTRGGWQYYDIMCYVTDNSIFELDKLIQDTKSCLKTLKVELTGVETPDFHDTELNAYMKSIEIRIAKEVNHNG